MTTGNDTLDQRALTPTSLGDQLVGTYWSRVWDGGDRAATSVSSPSYDPANGLYGGSRSRRPPKRGRHPGEHHYTMTLQSSFRGIIRYSYTASPQTTYTTTATSFGGNGIVTYKWSATDDLKLINKLKELLVGSDFNPAITLAEGKKSLQTIARAADALAGAYYHAKRGNFGAAGKSLAQYSRGNSAAKTLGQNWLNYQYGIRPILNDTYNAACTLAHLCYSPARQSYTVQHFVPGVVSSAAPSVSDVGGNAMSIGKLKAVLTEVDTIKLLGLTDPASVAWELVPYSFVIDWFLPIGTFLNARAISQGLTGTFVTTRCDKAQIYSMSLKPGSGIQLSGSSNYHARYVTVTRTVSGSLAVPFPSVKGVGDWSTWNHAVTAVSLLLSRRGSVRGSQDGD